MSYKERIATNVKWDVDEMDAVMHLCDLSVADCAYALNVDVYKFESMSLVEKLRLMNRHIMDKKISIRYMNYYVCQLVFRFQITFVVSTVICTASMDTIQNHLKLKKRPVIYRRIGILLLQKSVQQILVLIVITQKLRRSRALIMM